jgi:hypothetical protein
MLKRHTGHTSPVPGAVKSPVALAQIVYRTAQAALDEYSHPFSRHDFTQAQLFAILVLRVFFRTDYRTIVSYLHDFSDLRKVLELGDRVPHYSTLCYAEQRLLKKRPSRLSKLEYFSWLGTLDSSGELVRYEKAS